MAQPYGGYGTGMESIERLLDEVYAGQERVTRDAIHRRAVAEDLPAAELNRLEALPEGEYAYDEALAALARPEPANEGVPPVELSDEDLLRELTHLHRTRDDTFHRGSGQALARHTSRTTELEVEYLRRFPDRDIDPERLREGARLRE
jgi:hypothetical protein